MKAYSLDLRQRIADALQNGDKEKDVAARFDVSLATVQRIDRRLRLQQGLTPKTSTGRTPRLSAEHKQALAALLAERTDWTLQTLAKAWQEQSQMVLPKSTLHDAVRRAGWRFKKRVGSPPSEAP